MFWLAGSLVMLTGCPDELLWTIPNVVGQTEAITRDAISGAGLPVGQVTQVCSDTVPAGIVISQSPASGVRVALGSAVNLVVSSGPCPVTVPNLVRTMQTHASTELGKVGLVVGQVMEQCGLILVGEILSQSPAAGEQVARGSAVNLVVSNGPCPLLWG